MKDRSKFPPGWDEERVRRVLEHYEGQSAAAAALEYAAAFAEQGQTVMVIPNELVPAVRTLLASNESIKTEFWDEIRAIHQEERAEKWRNTQWIIGAIFAATALWVAVVKLIP